METAPATDPFAAIQTTLTDTVGSATALITDNILLFVGVTVAVVVLGFGKKLLRKVTS